MQFSIPSPPFNTLPIGPLDIHFYGILIGIGVVLAISLTIRRYDAMGEDATVLEPILVRAVIFGFLGARAAYVSTHLDRFEGEWWKVIAIWEGGLALFGGLTVGTFTAVWLIRKRGGNAWKLIDAAAIGLPTAQAIGRWGNYFNQELFGTPSTLPWAVEIDPARRPAAYADSATFHPTFLYESLWNAVIVIPLLLWLERNVKLPTGGLFMVYAALYGVGRFSLELIRTDTTFRLLGLSRNAWVALIIVGVSVAMFMMRKKAEEGSAAESSVA